MLVLRESPVVEGVTVAHEIMSTGHGADEPAVRDVSEGREVGVLAARRRNGTAALNPSQWFTVVWIG